MSIKIIVNQMQRGNYKTALSMIQKKLGENPNNPDLLYNLIVCYNRIEQYSNAIDTIKSFILKFSSYHSIANIYKLLIYAYIKIENYEIAIETTKQRLDHSPRDLILLSFKAYSHEKIGDIEIAINTHKLILDIDKNYKNSLNSLAALLVSRKKNPTENDLELAYRSIEKLIELEPNNGIYLDTYGLTLVALNKKKEAKEYFKKAVELAPDKENVVSNYKKYCENS